MSASDNPFEKHYTVQELAAMWGFSEDTVRRMVMHEPGVLNWPGMGSVSGKRVYTTRKIPESVALRIYERLKHPALKVQLSPLRPKRIVFNCDRNRRVA